MLFNSVHFILFLPLVFAFYWLIFGKKLILQNTFILLASYFFYGFWDFRFLALLAFSTLLDYYTGIKIHESANSATRKFWLCTSIIVNLSFLGFFKYYNFFIDSFADLLMSMGWQVNVWSLNIILPVGISFYTFHGLSYVLDIYNRKITPAYSIINYSVFVSFFPLLVAGPIERATHLLPQIIKPRQFVYPKAVDGMRQILWGLFKKVVVADTCAMHVDVIFDNYQNVGSFALITGAILFAFQIYGDFSGYSDIALGCARLFGFELLRNFAFPYFSRNIAEFWRRWHISLSSWFRDYLYIPLGGSKVSKLRQVRNTFIIFIVSGFWHGANWTFILWGLLNALYFLPLLLVNKNRNYLDHAAENRLFPTVTEYMQIGTTFILTCFAWIFFRSESATDALEYLAYLFIPGTSGLTIEIPWETFLFIGFLVTAEWFQRKQKHALENLGSLPTCGRWALYFFIGLTVGMYFGNGNTFIYFQF